MPPEASPPQALSAAWDLCERVRSTAPIVHNITNHVVMNITANALLAAGASPIMAHAAGEMAEIVHIADALVLNIGTLSPDWISSMFLAGCAARRKGIPVALDPVGAGASRLRTRTALDLLEEIRPAILRGNASEIMALAGTLTVSRGVDSSRSADAALDSARLLAERYGCTVVVSGEIDLVLSSAKLYHIYGGHNLMPKITGMGCTATALVAACAAVALSPFEGAVGGMTMMAAAGGFAGESAHGPASFQTLFLDTLYGLTRKHLETHAHITEPA